MKMLVVVLALLAAACGNAHTVTDLCVDENIPCCSRILTGEGWARSHDVFWPATRMDDGTWVCLPEDSE